MLGQLLAADPCHRGQRVPCGRGHEAEFVSYRDKVIDTVLGPVTLTRAWYHCAACGRGFAPRDAELDVEGASLSPGLTARHQGPIWPLDHEHRSKCLVNVHANRPLTPSLRRIRRQRSVRWGKGGVQGP